MSGWSASRGGHGDPPLRLHSFSELLSGSQIQHLAQLAPGDAVVGPEGAVGVAGDEALGAGGLYVVVEGRAAGHVGEAGVRWVEQRPVFGDHSIFDNWARV